MRLIIFPAAFMANTFAMMLVMIALSLFGKPGLAADFGMVHGATVALFYSFSGNARSLILGVEGLAYSPRILRMRLLMVVPLGLLAWILCAGVVDGGGLFVLALVLRRAVEWIAEVFLSEQEVRQEGVRAMQFLVSQGALSLLLLVVLLGGGWLVLPMMLLWATSPLLGCLNLSLLRRALTRNMPLLAGMRVLLPHFGSTAVIGISVYVFRLFLLLVAGKEVAGDLFSAFAMGGILGAVFSQALGPSMVRQEQAALSSTKLVRLFNGMLCGLVAIGVALGVLVWSQPGLMGWTLKSDFFWLAVACSLVGGGVMVQAQRIRLRIIQGEDQADVFGSDILANILLVASIPFLYFGLGLNSLVVLYLLSGVFALFFYSSERSGFVSFKNSGWLSEKMILVVIAALIMLPVFFQLNGGVFIDKAIYFNSEGKLFLLPIPISVIACYCGIFILGRYGDARLTLVTIFFLFLGMLFVSLLMVGSGKLILLVQYVLPFFALVLGQQYGQRDSALYSVAVAGGGVLSLLVPLQLLSTVLAGTGYLVPSVFLFSIYQHLQYVPVMFVGIFLVSVFALGDKKKYSIWLVVLASVMGAYAVVSLSMAAQALLLLGILVFVVRHFFSGQVVIPLVLTVAVGFGGSVGYVQISDSALFLQKYSTGAIDSESGVSWVGGEKNSFNNLPLNLIQRQKMWGFYFNEITDDVSGLFLGHSDIPDRNLYPSAHNYYLDFIYHFGLVGVFPILFLLAYTILTIFRNFESIWRRVDLLGVSGVVVFFLIVDNSLKVGFRQPYPGIIMFFFWGVLLSLLISRSDVAAQQGGLQGTGARIMR